MAAWPVHAAIAVVQIESCSAHGATTCTTGNLTTTTGNLFVVSTSYCCAAFTSITDSKSNSYATNAIADTNDGDGGTIRQDYKESGTGGATHNWTLTGASGAFFGTISVMEVSGAASSPLDLVASQSDAGTAVTSGSTATTSQADELLIGVGGTINLATFTNDGGAGWTERHNIATDVNTEGIITGSQVVSATGTYAYTFTSSSADDHSAGISTWKAGAAGTRQRCIGCGTDKKVIGE